MARVIAIDWSGARVGSEQRIWIAEAVDGDLQLLENGRSRAQVIAWLNERRSQVDDAIVGVDFAFSYPHWFLDQHGCSEIGQLWDLVARFGEEWLATCPAPFWGRPGKRRGDEQQLRACETGWNVRGIVPKSVFQIGGAGACGTGSIRGMPLLRELRAGGWSIWPFDPVSTHLVAEIWPRLLTGPVAKSSPIERRAWLTTHTEVHASLANLAASSEDAFDAAASAIVLSRCSDLAETLTAPLVGDPREGSMLVPPSALMDFVVGADATSAGL